MKIFINGEIIEATEEQIAEFTKRFDGIEISLTVTDKERISALESAIADIAMMVVGVSNND